MQDKQLIQDKCTICGKELEKHIINNSLIQNKTIFIRCKCEKEADDDLEELRFKKEKVRRVKELFNISGLGPKFQERTFESWKQRPGSDECFRTAKDFATNFKTYKESGQSILFMGDPGNGKTHLAAAVVNQLIPQEYSCIFINNVTELLVNIENSYRDNDSKYSTYKVLNLFKMADLVILNDLGKEKYTDKRFETIFLIIDTLYNFKKNIIVTMNFDSNQKMCSVSELKAVMDRIIEMCKGNIVKNNALSYRRE